MVSWSVERGEGWGRRGREKERMERKNKEVRERESMGCKVN